MTFNTKGLHSLKFHHSCAFDCVPALDAHDIAVAFELREVVADEIAAGGCVNAERGNGLPENVHDCNVVHSRL